MEFLETIFQQVLGGSSEHILSLANPKWDIVVFVFLFITTLFYGLGLTKNKIITFLFSTYIALAIVGSLPFTSSYWSGFGIDSTLSSGFIFIAIIIFIIVFIFVQAALKRCFLDKELKGSVTHNFLLSFLHVGLIINIALSSLPPEIASTFSLFTQRLFIGDIARFFWFLLPIMTVILLKRDTLFKHKPKKLEPMEKEKEE